jgi:hypothetical protein
MTAFNVVRFRVKPGGEEVFLEVHRAARPDWPGARRFHVVDAGDRRYFVVGEWDSIEAMAAARPMMIGMLDTFRHVLEDLGDGLGVTDPISGTAVIEARVRA